MLPTPNQPLDPDRLKQALSHWMTYVIPAATAALSLLMTEGQDGIFTRHDFVMAAVVFLSTIFGLLVPTPGVNQPYCNDPEHKPQDPPKQ